MDSDSSTSHPAVRAAIDNQAKTFFSQIAKDHVTPIWKTVITSLIFLVIAFIINSIIDKMLLTNFIGEISTDRETLKKGLVVGFLFIAATYLVGGLNNRRNRTRFFAAALWEMITREGGRDRFQIETVVQGGKIGSILDKMNAEKNSRIDIQWTFFYREEHSSRLFADCVRNNQYVRILLCKPNSASLLTRVQDMKRDYKDPWRAAHAELSLGNLTFAREFLLNAERNPILLDHCEVRFSDVYIGRPEVIITPNAAVKPFPVGLLFEFIHIIRDVLYITQFFILKIFEAFMPRINFATRFPAIMNFLFSNNFNSELKKTRVGMGIYLTQESSKYPFFIFRPEPNNDASNLVPGDAVTQFDLWWDSANKLSPCKSGGPLDPRGVDPEGPYWLMAKWNDLIRSCLRFPSRVCGLPSAFWTLLKRGADIQDLLLRLIKRPAQSADGGRSLFWPPHFFKRAPLRRRETSKNDTMAWIKSAISEIDAHEKEVFELVDIKVPSPPQDSAEPDNETETSAPGVQTRQSSRLHDDMFEVGGSSPPRWVANKDVKIWKELESLDDSKSSSPEYIQPDYPQEISLESQFVRITFFLLSLIISLIIDCFWGKQNTFIDTSIKLIALILQSVSLAILFSIVDPRDLKTQFDGCVRDLNAIVKQQEKFGIVNVVEGGKFYDIIRHMNVEYGDKVLIHWSFLQHEQASEDFKTQVNEQNLDVALLLMEPFAEGLKRRAQALAADHPAAAKSMFAAKSLGNLDFIRRQAHFSDGPAPGRKSLNRYRVRFSALQMGRPMIIVCKEPEYSVGTRRKLRMQDLIVKQVALGHFLIGESSKYPFIIFEADKAIASKDLSRDALDFFINRWRDATPLESADLKKTGIFSGFAEALKRKP